MPTHFRLMEAPDQNRSADHSSCARPPRSPFSLLLLLAVLVVASGCGQLKNWYHNGFKVGPEYCRPAAPVADDWIEAYNEKVRSDLPNNPTWWEVFEDPTLNELIESMYAQNLTLRAAGMRVLKARAQRGIAVGGLFPQFQEAFGEYRRTQLSLNQQGLGQLVGTGFPINRQFSNWTTGFNSTWEIDVWGKFRRNIEAADADLDASIEDYDAILVSLLADVASTYIEYRTFNQQLAYARRNIEIQEGSLGIAVAQFEGGRVSELDVTQARANLKNTEQLVPLFEAQARNASLRLCTLLGIPPRDLSAEVGEEEIPRVPPTVAVGIPADLLRRRPDIRAAERRVAAQSARIGVATADLFPHFSIFGSLSFDSQQFKNLFASNSAAGIIAPAFNWDILNYGRLLNNIAAQDAQFQELALTYQQRVLEANQEVESGIINFLKSQERLIATQEAVKASQRSVEIVSLQYKEGAVDFNRVFNLQLLLVEDQDRLATTQGDVAQSLVAIYRALGGGWEIRMGAVPAAENAELLPLPEDVPPLEEEAAGA